MRIRLIAIGRSRPGPHRALFDHYAGRIGFPVTVHDIALPHPLPPEKRRAREGELLLAAAPEGAIIVALDERGQQLASEAFARRLGRWLESGARDVAFLIGGAEGLSEAVQAKANLVLSLGKMTWPHRLVPALLAEQLYRAETILAGHPYHRE
ncbi:MAG: 23S rRNA (pseudouridine(1915)-N(3))-methyltransferase RlmH [Alphaproteobacteria bacterium]